MQTTIGMAATRTYLCLALLVLFSSQTRGQEWKLLFGLRGEWKFEIGDHQRWSDPHFDDSKWETIYAPGNWEDEGFPGYDGYAWYRKHFQATADWTGKALFARLGRIDDVDEVYVNGRLIGRTGAFPPEYQTAYNAERNYEIPPSALNIPGDNVIAVRVFDSQLRGGIYEGKLGVYEDKAALVPDVPLAGEWKFSTGDNLGWKEQTIDDKSWQKLQVPLSWEQQGYAGYDGYAWYRLRFRLPAAYASKRMILLLGYVDDFDEAYLNGTLIGKTGVMGRAVEPGRSDEWLQLRAYTIPADILQTDRENTLAVRVYDGYIDGGIYRGPIGLITRDHYLQWKRKQEDAFEAFRVLEEVFEKLK